MSRATLTIVAGANGAGKSTLTSGNLDFFSGVPLLDPDAFATMLRATKRAITSIGAGKEVLHLAKEDLEGRESFAVETTLSGRITYK